jgi:hypothetical protein
MPVKKWALRCEWGPYIFGPDKPSNFNRPESTKTEKVAKKWKNAIPRTWSILRAREIIWIVSHHDVYSGKINEKIWDHRTGAKKMYGKSRVMVR